MASDHSKKQLRKALKKFIEVEGGSVDEITQASTELRSLPADNSSSPTVQTIGSDEAEASDDDSKSKLLAAGDSEDNDSAEDSPDDAAKASAALAELEMRVNSLVASGSGGKRKRQPGINEEEVEETPSKKPKQKNPTTPTSGQKSKQALQAKSDKKNKAAEEAKKKTKEEEKAKKKEEEKAKEKKEEKAKKLKKEQKGKGAAKKPKASK